MKKRDRAKADRLDIGAEPRRSEIDQHWQMIVVATMGAISGK